MGPFNDTIDLIPYQWDSFFWWLNYNESARRERLLGYPKEILKFDCPSTFWWINRNVEMGCLTWKHEFQFAGPGEIFRKRTRNSMLADVLSAVGICKELRYQGGFWRMCADM